MVKSNAEVVHFIQQTLLKNKQLQYLSANSTDVTCHRRKNRNTAAYREFNLVNQESGFDEKLEVLSCPVL